jgi:tetratricopeptide (TPR) repeat protein
MIGAGRFNGDQFVLEQFFLRNPAEEKAQLAALTEFVDGAKAVVSYNGKSFDLPIINTRYILNHLSNPFDEMGHIDLLHITRRVWKRRLKQCNLGNIEKEILDFYRTDEDIPGYLVPEFYRNYIVDGDASQIAKIFYHNEVDVVSLSALFTTLAAILEDPTSENLEHAEDIYSIGRLMESLNREVLAEQLYSSKHFLSSNDEELVLSLLSRARIYKKNKKFSEALPLWMQAHQLGSIDAALELAKYFEHVTKDYQEALAITDRLMQRSKSEPTATVDNRVVKLIEHRRARLLKKIEKTKSNSP